MHARGKLALAIATGGIALGVVLGAAVNPEMKHAPEPLRQAALQDPATTDTSYQLAEFGSAETAPSWARDSYPPAWASEEITNWEPRYPAWTYSDLSDEPAQTSQDAQPEAPQPPEPAESAANEAQASEPRGEGSLAALY